MFDRARLAENLRSFHRELKDDARPVIAPYPERAPLKPWKGDRPIDRLLGWARLHPRLGRGDLTLRAEAIVALSDSMAALTDTELDARCLALRTAMRRNRDPAVVDECFALVREVTRRELGMAHFVVQIIGGLIMLDGGIAEMATGEGKTITAMLPAIAAALHGTPVHVFTVNDYLAERDAERLGPVYRRFGLTTGLIIHGVETDARGAAYGADVVYGTNKEITFDYLRDQTALGRTRGSARRVLDRMLGRSARPLLLRGLHFAIVDEADSIFIDEARTPLILSAEVPADDDGLYTAALELASRLERGRDFILREESRAIELTERGRDEIAAIAAGLPQPPWRIRSAREHLVVQALSATHMFQRDREYVVLEDKVQIVDESTGRIMADRSWEGGLHQLIEAKEQLALSGTRHTMARITYQRFFRRYLHLSGMSGTVREVAGELWADYGVQVTPVARNRPDVRVHRGHAMYRDAAAKWEAVARAVARVQAEEGRRPILVGTRSVADSESVAAALGRLGVAHRVLNARQDAEEAAIIAAAGELGAVTVATNMAGRGTDIILSAEARAAGGLHVILTAFHETARIDRQLYGRAGRQGDPGSGEAISAADDELYSKFSPMLTRLLVSRTSEWPVVDGAADWLRRASQLTSAKREAELRRQTELSEENLRKKLAFSGET
ncbi:MAG: RNA helicase SecA [Novosphingobium sp.]